MGEASFELDELDSNCFIQSLSSHISQDDSMLFKFKSCGRHLHFVKNEKSPSNYLNSNC